MLQLSPLKVKLKLFVRAELFECVIFVYNML